MRVVYLDEAGISDSGQEPFLVVAAAITNPDRHWHEIVNYYDDLARTWLDEYHPDDHGHFVFHAKDFWHGSGLVPRERFSLQDRMKIFRQLAQAPNLLGIPICVGAIDKSKVPEDATTTDGARKALLHALAFNITMQNVDGWMEKHCRGEIAMATAENTDVVRQALQLFHSAPQTNGQGYSHEAVNNFQIRAIVDSINFSLKQSSPIMQMADHCAFIKRRSFSSCPHIGEYLSKISPAIFELPQSGIRPLKITFKDEFRHLKRSPFC